MEGSNGDRDHDRLERKQEEMERRLRDMELAAAAFTSEYSQIAEDQDRQLQQSRAMHKEHYTAEKEIGEDVTVLKTQASQGRWLGGAGSLSGIGAWIKTLIESLGD